ncbi:sensor histidine kinase [Amycolatopsis sp. NPDC049868]|uniref:sensor histidine kinase n=1 Tax=Amycolatopsis sp. NPDC049868 TaxID=3363934 RepID=UPI00378A4D11
MNNHMIRGRGPEPLLTRFIVLCALQISTGALVAVGMVVPETWPPLAALALMAGAVGVGIALFLTAQRLRRSLTGLRAELDELGRQRLPEMLSEIVVKKDVQQVKLRLPTPVDERLAVLIGDVEEICTSAVHLAVERDQIRAGYAEVFVNMFRRTQTLLLRQLQIIEGLEQSNRSPADLNRFYQLDHLVMRMRRNNENILVLSGTELVRKTKDPVPISDILRASISEIDNYQRVRLLSTPSIRVSNTAAGDLIRIVAELLDNATAFSSPDKQVTVKAELARHQGLAIGVIDNGIGMSDVDIRKANEQLKRLGSGEIARSRRLGLLVVGRLAGRHGCRVELFGGDDVEGVSALVTVPSSVLLEEDAVRATLPGDPTRGSTMGHLGATANRAGRGESAVPMTVTVRRQDKNSPDAARVRRTSSWHNRSDVQKTRRQAVRSKPSDLVAQAHSDVPGELPTRVPNRQAEDSEVETQPRRIASRWFQARNTTGQGRSTSSPPSSSSTDRFVQGAVENWQSNVDQAWQMAENANRPDGYTYTEDGLPLRQKGAHLIPGSVAPASVGGTAAPGKAIERDPKHTQRRLSSYQQGVQKAKEQEARMRGTKHSAGWTVLEVESK